MFKVWIFILVIILIYSSFSDIKTKQINVAVLLLGIIASFFVLFIEVIFKLKTVDLYVVFSKSVMGSIPGLMILGVSKIGQHFKRQYIGEGDGYIILISGILAGLSLTLNAITVSFLLAAAYGTIQLIFLKKNKLYSFPFVPFYTLGFLLCLVKVIITNQEVLL